MHKLRKDASDRIHEWNKTIHSGNPIDNINGIRLGRKAEGSKSCTFMEKMEAAFTTEGKKSTFRKGDN